MNGLEVSDQISPQNKTGSSRKILIKKKKKRRNNILSFFKFFLEQNPPEARCEESCFWKSFCL
jgi:hypothetical protein